MFRKFDFISCLLPAVLSLLAGCGHDPDLSADTTGEGCLHLNVSLPGTRSEYDPLAISTLKIYNAEGGLIRKYTPANNIPADIYLAAGTYRVTVTAGDQSPASFTHKSYEGEETFAMIANQSTRQDIVCKITNSAVRVDYDATIERKFDKGFRTYVSAIDRFDKVKAEQNLVPTLTYTSDGTGYFLLPEGTKNLSWGFYGNSTDLGAISQTGVIEAPEPNKRYTLAFRYSNTPDGYLTLRVLVQEDGDLNNDDLIFNPQPSVQGNGFDLAETQLFRNQEFGFAVSSINAPLATVTLTADGVTYTALDKAARIVGDSANGLAMGLVDDNNAVLTVTPAFIAKLGGGSQQIAIRITDADDIEGSETFKLIVPGTMPLSLSDCDFWFNTATFRATVTGAAPANVQMRYREIAPRTTGWTSVDAVKDSGYTYSAIARNDDHTAFCTGKTYEYQLLIDGTEQGAALQFTTPEGAQLPNAGFEQWHQNGKPWYPYAQGDTGFWDTGNPGSTTLNAEGNITTAVENPRPGSAGRLAANLQTKFIGVGSLGKLAAGNIFAGNFGKTIGARGGTVLMGKPFSYVGRPRALRFWYRNNAGSGDKARVFICLCNWTGPHTIDTTNIGETALDPAMQSTAEGDILAYGDWSSADSQSEWACVEIPIAYHDRTLDQRANYIVVTASASYRGDYFEGSTDSWLQLDDFELIY